MSADTIHSLASRSPSSTSPIRCSRSPTRAPAAPSRCCSRWSARWLARGHRTTVAACDGSQVSGRLLATGNRPRMPLISSSSASASTARAFSVTCSDHPDEFDLIHDESGSFFRHADRCPVPVLATLHLPRSFYREEWLCRSSQNLASTASRSRRRERFADLPNLIGVVQNGIASERFPFVASASATTCFGSGASARRKAPHLAIAAANKPGMPLILAGQVYPFSYHQQYFEREIRPWLERASSSSTRRCSSTKSICCETRARCC